MDTSARTAAARAFVRSLNILLKFARMYDFGHPRTAAQYETAWKELRTALGDNESGLLLAASGDKLLLDGVALESAQAEKSFARLLSSAGIASIHFSPKVTQASLGRLVKGFPSGSSARPEALAEQLKSAIEDAPGIQVNEVCFVPADSAVAKSQVAASITAATLGLDAEQCNELFKDPQMLLQLIAAAEGSRSGPGGGPGGPGGSGGTRGAGGPGGGPGGSSGGPGGGFGGPGGGPGGPGWSGGAGGGGHEGGASLDTMDPSQPHVQTHEFGAPDGAQAPAGNMEGVPVRPLNASDVGLMPSGYYTGTEGANASAGLHDALQGGHAGAAHGEGDVAGVALGGSRVGDMVMPSGLAVSGPAVAGATAMISGWMEHLATIAAGEEGETDADGGASAPEGPSGRVAAKPHSGRRGGGGGNFFGLQSGSPGSGPSSRWANATASLRVPMSGVSGKSGSASLAEAGVVGFEEEEVQGLIKMLAQIAEAKDPGRIDTAFQSRLSTLPRRARFTLSQALSALAAQSTSDKPEEGMLLKLAEHIAIRFAMQSYERGDIQVNAVQETLDRMGKEVENLKKILGVHEERMARAGLRVSSHAEILAKQFWKEVPAERKQTTLLSADAWCVPAHNIREYLEELQKEAKSETALEILRNYASGIRSREAKIRHATAIGLTELASLYSSGDEKLFVETIREAGLQLKDETQAELQSLVSAAFVRLSQEAIQRRAFPAIQRAIELVDFIETEKPDFGKTLRPRVSIETRLPEFIEEALKAGRVSEELGNFLRRIPRAASEQLAARFSRSGFREESQLLLDLVQRLAPEGIEHLKQLFEKAPQAEALDIVGMMSRLDHALTERVLPVRLGEWKRSAHDRVVRQLGSSGSPERGRLLLGIFDLLDPLIRPLALDEIGFSGEHSGDLRLVRLAEGDLPDDGSEYLQLKAVEALGRLRTAEAEMVLRRILEARQVWRWAFPSELRIVAAQALQKIDPDFVKDFLPRSGLSVSDLSLEPLDADPNSSCMRQRRYVRLRLESPVPGVTMNLKQNCRVEVPEMNLAGGVAMSDQRMHPGALVSLKLNPNGKPVKAQAIVRDATTQARAFELVDMELEERAKLRRLLIHLGNVLSHASPENRSRNRGRTILSSSNS